MHHLTNIEAVELLSGNGKQRISQGSVGLIRRLCAALFAVVTTCVLCLSTVEVEHDDLPPIISAREPVRINLDEAPPPEKKKVVMQDEQISIPKTAMPMQIMRPMQPIQLAQAPQLSPLAMELPAPAAATMPTQPVNAGSTKGMAQSQYLFAGMVDTPPRVKKYVPPRYPAKARGQQVEGIVTVRVLVSPTGKVKKATVLSANPEGYFEHEALVAIKRWKFTSPKHLGERVDVLIDIPLKFTLD